MKFLLLNLASVLFSFNSLAIDISCVSASGYYGFTTVTEQPDGDHAVHIAQGFSYEISNKLGIKHANFILNFKSNDCTFDLKPSGSCAGQVNIMSSRDESSPVMTAFAEFNIYQSLSTKWLVDVTIISENGVKASAQQDFTLIQGLDSANNGCSATK